MTTETTPTITPADVDAYIALQADAAAAYDARATAATKVKELVGDSPDAFAALMFSRMYDVTKGCAKTKVIATLEDKAPELAATLPLFKSDSARRNASSILKAALGNALLWRTGLWDATNRDPSQTLLRVAYSNLAKIPGGTDKVCAILAGATNTKDANGRTVNAVETAKRAIRAEVAAAKAAEKAAKAAKKAAETPAPADTGDDTPEAVAAHAPQAVTALTVKAATFELADAAAAVGEVFRQLDYDAVTPGEVDDLARYAATAVAEAIRQGAEFARARSGAVVE